MDIHLALDALLAFIILLFIPIGLWRGAVREAMVAAAILLGATLAGAWARPWGDDLAARTAFEPPTARFAVAIVALVLCTVLLGYGGGAVWRGEQPGTFGRFVGGLLAVFNGVLLLGFALNFLDRYLLEGDRRGAIADGWVARVLLTEFGWLLLGAAALLLAVVAVGLLLNTLRGSPRQTPPFPAVAPLATSATTSRRGPPRVPSGSDAGKSEPVWHAVDDDADRFGFDAPHQPIGERRSFEVSRSQEPSSSAEEASTRRYGGAQQHRDQVPLGARNATSGSTAANEWLRRTAAMSRPSESGVDASARPGNANIPSTNDRRRRADDPTARQAPDFSIVDLGEVRRSHRGQWGQDETFATGNPEAREADRDHRRFSSSPSRRTEADTRNNGPFAAETAGRCSTCSAPLSSSDTFCSSCGAQA